MEASRTPGDDRGGRPRGARCLGEMSRLGRFAAHVVGPSPVRVGLPRDGIDGAGRPTRIDVVDTGWRTVGPLSDEPKAALLPVAGFVVPFPTYPEGPVTLRQAIASSGARAEHAVDVEVTFMACSSAGLCYKPEIGHPMVV